MRLETTTSWLAASAALLATAVMAGPASAAPAAATAAAPVTHRTIFANHEDGALYRLELDPTGAVTARTVVDAASGAAASDYDGTRMVFTLPSDPPDRAHDQVWLREATGAFRFLAAGHLATFNPDRTGVTIARHVAEGRDPDSKDPAHDEVTVHRLADGHVFELSPHSDGIRDLQIRNSHDGKSLWMLVAGGSRATSATALMRYDRATDTTRKVLSLTTQGCADFEILPSGANALLACGAQLLTVQLATGKVTHRTAMPSGVFADSLGGRLNPTTMLLSVFEHAGHAQLAALDLTTMRTRILPGTDGYMNAVAAY